MTCILDFIDAKYDETIGHAKLQSNRHHQQTNTRFFTGRMPFLSPNQQCRRLAMILVLRAASVVSDVKSWIAGSRLSVPAAIHFVHEDSSIRKYFQASYKLYDRVMTSATYCQSRVCFVCYSLRLLTAQYMFAAEFYTLGHTNR